MNALERLVAGDAVRHAGRDYTTAPDRYRRSASGWAAGALVAALQPDPEPPEPEQQEEHADRELARRRAGVAEADDEHAGDGEEDDDGREEAARDLIERPLALRRHRPRMTASSEQLAAAPGLRAAC